MSGSHGSLRGEHSPVTEPETAKHATSQRVYSVPISDGASPSLICTGTANALDFNVACDMPGQILYMNWLLFIMPLSTSMLNCAISLGRKGPGSCFTTTGLLTVKLNLNAKRNCAISLGREGPGTCYTISGLLSLKLCHQFGKRRAGELFYNNQSAQC